MPTPHAITNKVTLAVRNLRLMGFRSYENLNLDVDPVPVVLTGANGAGKTNLLEALSLLAPGRGLRQASMADFRLRGGDLVGWGISAHLETADGSIDIGTGEDDCSLPGRRKVRINGDKAIGQNHLSEYLHVVWLTPQMDRLFTDSPSGKRRFFDRLVSGFYPEHARRLTAYQRCLRERMEMLRQNRIDNFWLTAVEETLSEHGVAVTAARSDVLNRLNILLQSPYESLFPKVDMELTGAVESWLADMPATAVEERVRAALASSRSRDSDTGRTLFGPHRTELLVRHANHDLPAEQCSTGEQKMLLVSIILAHAQAQVERTGQTPLVLLDEAMAHLDATHRRHLIDILCFLGVQAWLTGVEPDLFSAFAARAQFLNINEGRIGKCKMERRAW